MATPDAFAAACREAARDIRRLPTDLRRAFAQRTRDVVAEPLASRVRGSGRTALSRAVATTVKVRAQGDPTIVVGGQRRVVSGGATGRQLVWGVHFQSGKRVTAVPSKPGRRGYKRRSTRQFVGRQDPFVFRTAYESAEWALEKWATIVDEVLRKVGPDGQ